MGQASWLSTLKLVSVQAVQIASAEMVLFHGDCWEGVKEQPGPSGNLCRSCGGSSWSPQPSWSVSKAQGVQNRRNVGQLYCCFTCIQLR